MFDKLKIKIFKKLLEKTEPDRDYNVIKIGRRYFITARDSEGQNDYVLDGQYSYDDVMRLQPLAGGECKPGFGYCEGIGPVAFIGVVNPDYEYRSGYFKYNVQGYGDSINEDECKFTLYSDEEAKNISNYTVYGMGDPRVLNGIAPIKKVKYYNDYRYERKNVIDKESTSGTLEMDIRLGGTYSFSEARKFAYGSTGPFTGASGEDVPIQFAIVGDNQPVGILGLWHKKDNATFRDVWAKGEDEPKTQPICFLTDDDARKINNYKLYYYVPTHSYGKKQYTVEKRDRMLEADFDFIMEDGKDYRLKEPISGRQK